MASAATGNTDGDTGSDVRATLSATAGIAWDRIWVGAHLATMAEDGSHGGAHGREPYGALRDHALAVCGERIAWIGPSHEALATAAKHNIPVENCAGQWMTPGLIDCHTHLVYGGNRVKEFEQRLCGASYEEIARAGGGIQATVDATRADTEESLLAAASGRARRLMAEGVTTLEIKSGYGLDLATERRLLKTARELGRRLPVSIKATYLGLHALPQEYRNDRSGFIAQASGPWLEALAGEGLVDAVDAFCENIAFSLDETSRFLEAAWRLGLPAHVHAGQLSDMAAAELAARCGALSADHLEFLSDAGVRAMAASGTVAVLLPGAYFVLRQSTPPPVVALRRADVPMAVATDSNPGSSPCTSILLMLNMACTLFGLTPEEALLGVTRNAARALGVQAIVGTLEVGKRADFALWQIERPAELCYHLGANPCVHTVYKGRLRAAGKGMGRHGEAADDDELRRHGGSLG